MSSEHKPNCAECQNLEPGGWCKALLRSVSGSRHIRKCRSFVFNKHNPKPVRKGCKQNEGLVQCTSCEYFIPWGLCGYGEETYQSHSYLGRLEPGIWRRCSDYEFSEEIGFCNDCVFQFNKYCNIAKYPITGTEKKISCKYFVAK